MDVTAVARTPILPILQRAVDWFVIVSTFPIVTDLPYLLRSVASPGPHTRSRGVTTAARLTATAPIGPVRPLATGLRARLRGDVARRRFLDGPLAPVHQPPQERPCPLHDPVAVSGAVRPIFPISEFALTRYACGGVAVLRVLKPPLTPIFF